MFRLMSVLFLLVGLGSFLGACGDTATSQVPALTVGATQTTNLMMPLPADKSQTADVSLTLQRGTSTISVGGNGLVQGRVQYNVDQLKPNIATTTTSIMVQQNPVSGLPSNATNDWQVQFGQGVPISLTINSGANKGQTDLGGLSLRSLSWSQGAADGQLTFSQPNPQSLANFNLQSGNATVNIKNLANANIKSGNINVGAGTVNLYFDGKLTQNADISLNGGTASFNLYAAGNPVELKQADAGSMGSVNKGSWTQSGNIYDSPQWVGASGPKITIHYQLGAGSINLQ